MPLVADILESYAAPRRVAARRLPTERREDRTYKRLVLAGVLMAIAATPVALRDTLADGTAAFYAWLFWLGVLFVLIQPLVSLAFSSVVALGFWLARSGRAAHRVRAAWAWALLAAAPVYFAAGILGALVGPVLPGNPGTLACFAAIGVFFGAGLTADHPKGATQ